MAIYNKALFFWYRSLARPRGENRLSITASPEIVRPYYYIINIIYFLYIKYNLQSPNVVKLTSLPQIYRVSWVGGTGVYLVLINVIGVKIKTDDNIKSVVFLYKSYLVECFSFIFHFSRHIDYNCFICISKRIGSSVLFIDFVPSKLQSLCYILNKLLISNRMMGDNNEGVIIDI